MKYLPSKIMIVLGSVLAVVGVWASMAWPDWTAASQAYTAAATIDPALTVDVSTIPAPVVEAVATEPPPPAQQPAVVVRRIVYVPVAPSADSADTGAVASSGGGTPSGESAPPPAAVSQPAPAAPVAPAPAAPAPPAAPVAPAPAATPVHSGGS